MSRVLVVGGAGYIGSHMVWWLGQQGVQVVTLDNLGAGHRDAVLHGELVVGDLADRALLDGIFSAQRFDAVMHFASCIEVGESITHPAKYYRNNVANTLNLLEAMQSHGVRQLVFSSTAAVYGEPRQSPISEDHPKNPLNPYGRSKWMVEQILADHDRAWGLRSVCLRYFNAAGAHPQGLLGERHQPETHLIPLALQAASGQRTHLTLFGQDYDTPDGTCLRDFVHVMDLAQAHALALDYLAAAGETQAFNLGNGAGYSVREVIDTAQSVTGLRIAVEEAARRPGDPARLVADAGQALAVLGWKPRYPELKTIIAHAWQWEMARAAAPR